jgi:ActR/RegA family two-component response regulator
MLKTVAVVAPRDSEDVMDAVVEAGDYDVVFIESTDRAYSHIKQTAPHIVILVVSVDDPASLQVLSMLTLDVETSKIPVITHFSQPAANEVEALHWREAELAPRGALSMN